jgi:hypothetical protein
VREREVGGSAQTEKEQVGTIRQQEEAVVQLRSNEYKGDIQHNSSMLSECHSSDRINACCDPNSLIRTTTIRLVTVNPSTVAKVNMCRSKHTTPDSRETIKDTISGTPE